MKKILGIILIFGCMFFGAIGASIGNSVLAVFFCLSSLILGVYLISKSEEDEYKPSPEKKITQKKEYSEISFQPKIKETKTKQIKSPIEEKTIKKLSKEIVKPIEKTIENRFVHYTSNLNDNENSYPILKIPNENCIVRTHRIGTTKRKGFKDESFEKSISKLLSNKFEVSGNIRLNTGKLTRPFEPDIAIICSTNKNIRIDIEIDEPYAGITRQPTHCKGEDVNRDNYFRNRGWIVIRFSELQVHTKEIECLNFIVSVINSIDNSIQISNDLKSDSKIENEILWDIVQAQKWEKEKYRENYLNHTFSELTEQQETIKRDFNKQEIEEEKLVKPTSFGIEDLGKNISFNKKNAHKKDSRIKFYSEPHIYTIDNVPATSASTIISRFFPEFDSVYWSNRKAPQLGMTAIEVAKMWSDKGKVARDKGTFLHEQIENYYLGEKYSEMEEFNLFKQFLEKHSDLVPYRSEWRIFDQKHNIAGTIDLLAKNGENGFDIYDWKRSKKIINTFNHLPIITNQWQSGIGKLNKIDDTSYNRYTLQQSLYRYILEENYGLIINNMFLIVLYPEYDRYYKLSVPYLKNEIEYILKTV
ncbi:hypothetical protein KO506_06790 [Polaribacter vadi]|uniref:hypothetical protein n=1 Tax=Polaribacter TaxID=52959 RepID=UPI001C07F583|nr:MULTISPECIES: hypothetical protein [Polaribacter]MBU3011102.1 hypothetical protein [Polaribacter vadi]MDO6740916.1 hypothetical protein [Polaribacter sp. 1_MG-2023]